MKDVVTQEIVINAPIQTAWNVVIALDTWFSEKATFELQPGAKGSISWSSMGDAPIEVITVDQPHTFAFAWTAPDEETHKAEGQTLITFTLTEIENATQLRVTESGFSKLVLTNAEKASLADRHESGWAYFVGKIRELTEKSSAQA